jgi:hypothetical protein
MPSSAPRTRSGKSTYLIDFPSVPQKAAHGKKGRV